MNRFYRHIWSRPLGQVVAIPECARGGAGRKAGRRRSASLVALALILAAVPASGALADTTWTNAGGDNDWNNPANWSNGLPVDNAGQTTRIVGNAPAVVDGVATTGSGRTWVGSATEDGTLIVENGGTLAAGTFEPGGTGGFIGNVVVRGNGSSIDSTSGFIGAYGRTGHVLVEDGGTLSTGTGYLGQYDGSLGTVTVTGTGSTWSSDYEIYVGGTDEGPYSATGILTVTDGGHVNVDNGGSQLVVTTGAGIVGTVNIGADKDSAAAGAGTIQASSIVFGAGDASLVFNHTDPAYNFSTPISGNGEVRQIAGTTIFTGTNTYSGNTVVEGGILRAGVAGGLSGNSLYEVNGGTLDLNDFDLTMPSLSGTGGTVDLGSAELTVDQDDDTSFSGAITGSGSFVKLGQGVLSLLGINTYSGSTEVAEGTLEVSGGGALAGASGAIGGGLGETGEVTISGVSSVWNISGEIHIGDAGTGTLGVAAGGVVSATNGYIANQAGSSGDVTVDGAGSEFNLSGNLAVGNSGDATLAVSDGGAVSNIDGLIGYFAAGSSAVTVDGEDSAWTNSGELTIGVWGGATLDITDGGAVSNTIGYIGRHATGDGEVTVTGADSIWTNSGSLFVGDAGSGTLTLSDSGTAEAASVTIASNASSTGTLNIGAASGDAAAAAGALDAASIAFGAGDGTLVFNHTGNGYIFGTAISGAGEVLVENGETVFTGAATHTGGTTISGGTLQIGNGGTTGSVAGDIANSGTLIFDRSDAYTYAGDLSGAGDIRLLGAGTTRLTGSSSGFTGSFFVEAGMLIVDDIIGGTLSVTGARLGGGGNLENVTIGNGGVLAPGNSVGTMIAYGDAVFGNGALYEVEVNDGTSLAFVDRPGVNNDFLDVRGSLTIDNGAAVHVTPENGTDDGSTYTPGLIYTIITASNGVTGTFGSVTTDFAFLAPELTYGANDVFLELVHNNVDFSEVAETPNQQGVSSTVQQFGPGHPLYDEIIAMTDEEARAAYDALSGESHSSASTTQLMTAAEIRQQLLNRISAMFGSGGGGLASLSSAPAAGDAAPGTASIWGQLFGGWGGSDADAAAAAVDRRIHGFIGGADREIAPGISAGLALGYSRTSYSVAARASSGDSDNFHIAGYAGAELGVVDLRGILSYGYGHADTQRTVVVGGVTNNLSASYGTHTFQAAVEVAADFDAGPVTLTPFAGLAGVHVETESFTETGGPAALSFASSGNTTGVSTLGLRVGREAGQVALTGAAAWRHAFGDVEPASRAAFASAPASTFAVRGAPVSEDALVLDAGVTARLDASTTLSLGYSGEYASGARDHGLRAELRIEF